MTGKNHQIVSPKSVEFTDVLARVFVIGVVVVSLVVACGFTHAILTL